MQTKSQTAARGVPAGDATTRKIYIGIDPGKSGALIVRFPNGKIRAWHTPVSVTRFKYPKKLTKAGKPKVKTKTRYCPRLMLLIMAQAKKAAKKAGCEIVVCLERQWARPTDSKHVVTVFAEGYATWTTLIELLDLPLIEVSPSVWKPRYVFKDAPKDESIKVCKKLYPRLKLPLKKDECIAEAVLIADYVRRRDLGMEFPRKPPPRKVPVKRKKRSIHDDPPPRRERATHSRKSVLVVGKRKLLR